MRCSKLYIRVDPVFCIVLAIALLWVPVSWVFAWVLAAFVHELGHCAAVVLFDKKIYAVHMGLSGAVLQAEPLTHIQRLLCTLAGPVCGLCLIPLYRYFPKLALCALLQSGYNLLPLSFLDGGRALAMLLELLFGERVSRYACAVVADSALFLIAAASVYGCFYLKLGVVPVLLAFLLWIRNKKIKIPCKLGAHRVQ